ncbi:MAG: GNAT family N-acetyltransferase [Lachnospiraceae bacterium]|nr:GNAT family N-acetyltransferase [Lachnospiraceae bacterium]
MNIKDGYLEEDLFPKIFTEYEERDYGILFYNMKNKDSFDSNHAVIYKDRIHDLSQVLTDIIKFYKEKGSRPIIYQSMLDDNWFDEIKDELTSAGFESWVEDQEYMLQADVNRIIPNPEIVVRKVSEWSGAIENVFVEAEEPWEILVAKKTLAYPKTWMFAASLNGKTIGLLYGHISERACRVDYLLISKKHRKTGAGRALFYNYVEWCRHNGIENVYIWPDGDTPKRIYEEGGYRVVEVRKAGRAVLQLKTEDIIVI